MKNKSILATIIIFSTLAVTSIHSCKKNKAPRLSSINFYRTSNKFAADNFGENKFRTNGNLITFICDSLLMEYNIDNFELKTRQLRTFDQLTFSTLDTLYGFNYINNQIYINKLSITNNLVIKHGFKIPSAPKNLAMCTNPTNGDVYAFCRCAKTPTNANDTFLLIHYSRDLKLLNQTSIKYNSPKYIDFHKNYSNLFTLKVIDNELFVFASEKSSTLIKKLKLNLDTVGTYRNSVVSIASEKHVTYLYANNEFKILYFFWDNDIVNRSIYLDAFNTSFQKTKTEKAYSAEVFNALWTINGNNNIHCFSNIVESDGKFYFIDNSQLFEMDDNLNINTYPIPDLVELQQFQDDRTCTIYARSIIKTPKGFTLILAADAYKSTGLYFINIDKKGHVIN